MELRQLRFLVTLSEELHFTKAAEREHIAVGAFSEQIQRLERELGVRLVSRTTRRVGLTEAGHRLLEQVQRVLDEVTRLERQAAALSRAETGTLSVGLGASDALLVPAVVREFANRHPDVDLQACQYGYEDPSAGLRSGVSDVALVWGPQTTSGWDVATLREEPRVVALPAADPLAGRAEVTAAELLPRVWLDVPAQDPVWRDFWLLTEHRDGVPARMGATTSTADGLLELVAAQRGIALLPRLISKHLRPPGVCFVPVADAAPCIVAVARPQGDAPPLVRSFVEVALEVAAQLNRQA